MSVWVVIYQEAYKDRRAGLRSAHRTYDEALEALQALVIRSGYKDEATDYDDYYYLGDDHYWIEEVAIAANLK